MSGTHLASSGYADATREALAMHIIELAKRGERDVPAFGMMPSPSCWTHFNASKRRPRGGEHRSLSYVDSNHRQLTSRVRWRRAPEARPRPTYVGSSLMSIPPSPACERCNRETVAAEVIAPYSPRPQLYVYRCDNCGHGRFLLPGHRRLAEMAALGHFQLATWQQKSPSDVSARGSFAHGPRRKKVGG
jgi:hypothetical protein